MLNFRRTAFCVASICAVGAAVAVPWVSLDQTVYFRDGVQRDYLVLNRFQYSSISQSGAFKIEPEIDQKFKDFGIPLSTSDFPETGLIVDRNSKREYFVSGKKDGDINATVSRISAAMPWAAVAWHNWRHTACVIRGKKPGSTADVRIYVGKVGGQTVGQSRLMLSISVTE